MPMQTGLVGPLFFPDCAQEFLCSVIATIATMKE